MRRINGGKPSALPQVPAWLRLLPTASKSKHFTPSPRHVFGCKMRPTGGIAQHVRTLDAERYRFGGLDYGSEITLPADHHRWSFGGLRGGPGYGVSL
jgi:hypothetical protein